MNIDLIIAGMLQGLILAIIAFGVMIPFRFLNFPDLSAEGGYPLGGAVTASLILAGVPQMFSIFIAMLSAGLMAILVSQISLRMKVNSLLAGIILSTMVYTINLRVMGKPNIGLFDYYGFNFSIASLILVIIMCIVPFFLFLHTDLGLQFRAVGLNPNFAEKKGISINKHTSMGLFFAGMMFGLAGSIIVQIQQFMDIGMGIGIVIHGLASLMIGEAIFGNHTLLRQIIAPILGALVYQQLQGFSLSLGLSPSDLKFFTGGIVLLVLYLRKSGL